MRTEQPSTTHGVASNGIHVGSGYDCEVKLHARSSKIAIATLTEVRTGTRYRTELDIDRGADLQAIAVRCASGADLDGWDVIA